MPESIVLYAKVVPDPLDMDFFDIKLFTDELGQDPTDGKIEVPVGGAVISFMPIESQKSAWRFHELTIHPMGERIVAPLDLKWKVQDQLVMLNHRTTRRGATYSYTLSIDYLAPPANGGRMKIYLDPQMIDPAGPQPTE